MKLKFLLTIAIFFSILNYSQAQDKVLKVLCYHTFTNYYCSFIDFSYDEIEYHIKLLKEKGNRENFNNQSLQFDIQLVDEENVLILMRLIEKYRKGLEQEIFINF